MKLGNLYGATALRRSGDDGQALRRTVTANADSLAADLASAIEVIRADGGVSLRAIA